MTTSDRRDFLRLVGGATIATSFSQSIERALALPAHHRTGTIRDVEHIVVLTQENRSFDHYFGALRGVRGFGDPRPVVLPSGKTVWRQPNGDGELLPYRPGAHPVGSQFLAGTPHDWTSSHEAWNNGKYDRWVPSKGSLTMTYLTREDIPFHYALADAFTICDAYHCSVMGPTDPNRYYMWTGWVGHDGAGGGPVVDNAEAGYDWRTYPELLEKAGMSWKIYQDVGVGLDAAGFWGWTEDPYIGNYGDNSLLYFHQYQNAQPGSALYEKARTGTNIAKGGTLFDVLRDDVRRNALPQVSWIAAPETYSEHSNWPANYGAWYISQVLDALTANPEVWSKTVLLINYDENDGFFDHIVPPYAPQSPSQGVSTVGVADEIYPGVKYPSGPYGLGARVPLFAVSPWSKGGYVCSEVFDHTSVIRFIEQRFGVREPQISAWRRAVCGDLTSAFDFARPDAGFVSLPSTASYVPPDRLRHPDYVPAPPTTQTMPTQEPGLRHARALPYALHVKGGLDAAKTAFRLDFANKGEAGAWLQARSGDGASGPWSYTVEAGKSLSASLSLPANGEYDFSVYGPNGFLRTFKGGAGYGRADLEVSSHYEAEETGLELVVANRGAGVSTVSIENAYTRDTLKRRLAPGERIEKVWPLRRSFGWHDLLITVEEDKRFERRLAGHIENGRDSVSDPAFGWHGRRHVVSKADDND